MNAQVMVSEGQVDMNKIAPQDMRPHLMLSQSRLSTAEEVAQEFEEYWGATEEFSRVMTRTKLDSLLQLVTGLCERWKT